MQLRGKITKRDDEQHLVFGWASVAGILDSQGDNIPIEELERAAYNFVLEGRSGNEMHQDKQVARLVESMIFTPEKISLLNLPDDFKLGWFVGFLVDDEDVWQKIKSGTYQMFSIGGRAQREEMA